MMTGIFAIDGSFCLASRISYPFILGIIISSKIRSALEDFIFSNPSFPSRAIMISKPSLANFSVRTSPKKTSSSIIKIFFIFLMLILQRNCEIKVSFFLHSIACPKKPGKNIFDLILWYTNAIVRDGNKQVLAFPGYINLDLASLYCIFNCIFEQVLQHYAHRFWVGIDMRQIRKSVFIFNRNIAPRCDGIDFEKYIIHQIN